MKFCVHFSLFQIEISLLIVHTIYFDLESLNLKILIILEFLSEVPVDHKDFCLKLFLALRVMNIVVEPQFKTVN